MATEKSAAIGSKSLSTNEFQILLGESFRPLNAGARTAIERAVRSLSEQALSEAAVISDDVLATIRGFIAQIDHQLNGQINQILHHEKFQKIEGAWRGLSYLVNNSETDSQLKIRVLNISKTELGKTLGRYAGSSWDQSPIFKKLYSAEYGQFGGEPYACVVGDYHFDHSPGDVALLQQMAQIGSAAHAPFIAGAQASLMGMESWQEIGNPRDVAKLFSTPEHAAWRSLRESEDAKYLGLAMPRFLARLPYGSKTNPVEDFAFEEETDGSDHNKYVWANSAYAMATNVTRSFKMYGWCTSIRGVENGGVVEGLPVHTFKSSDGGVDMKCPTEVSIDDQREFELSNAGLLPLIHQKNSDMAVFFGGQSLQKPTEYNSADATANARLAARLPYLFATCRFAHYLKEMTRRKIATSMEAPELERWLSKWINQYVVDDPQNHGPDMLAMKPLKAATIEVRPIEGNPGAYAARFRLRPHYQLESVNIDLSLVSKIEKKS